MRYLWSALCKRAIIDHDTGKLSLIDIPEAVTITHHLPEPLPSNIGLKLDYTFAAVFWRETEADDSVEVRLFWRFPDGDKTLMGSHAVRDATKSKDSSFRFLLELQTIEFRGFGRYEIEIESRYGAEKKWRKTASYPLLMNLSPALSSTAPEQPSEPTPGAPRKSS